MGKTFHFSHFAQGISQFGQVADLDHKRRPGLSVGLLMSTKDNIHADKTDKPYANLQSTAGVCSSR